MGFKFIKELKVKKHPNNKNCSIENMKYNKIREAAIIIWK